MPGIGPLVAGGNQSIDLLQLVQDVGNIPPVPQLPQTFGAAPMPLSELMRAPEMTSLPEPLVDPLEAQLKAMLAGADRETLARLMNRVFEQNFEMSGEAFQFDEVSDDELRQILHKNIFFSVPGKEREL